MGFVMTRYKAFVWVQAVVLLLGFASARGAVVRNISTGIDASTGTRLADGTDDPQWFVGDGDAGQPYAGDFLIAKSDGLPSTYVPDADSTASRWIGINSGSGLQGISVPQGTYNFEVIVNLSGFIPSTAVLSASRLAADDEFNRIEVNGVTVYTAPRNPTIGQENWRNLSQSLGTGTFIPGLNTLTFVVDNTPARESPLAMRFEGSVNATPVPEPASALVAIVVSALLVRRYRWSTNASGGEAKRATGT